MEDGRVLYLIGPGRVELRREAVPTPATGQLVLRVAAATTCGTDLKVFRQGGHPRMLQVPCPFGHEVAGTVVACGPEAGRWQEADRVVVANSASCGRCEPCREGRENLCLDLHYLNGAFADYLLVPERFVRRSTYRLPPELDSAVAALAEPLACVQHGLSACAGVQPGEAIVLGGGPIGLMFVIELVLAGHSVILADPIAQRAEMGRRLGAEVGVELAGDESDRERLLAASRDGAGAALVVEATGVPQGWSSALGVVRPGGVVVLFGGCPPGTEVVCDTHRLHYSEITVKGVYHHRPATFAAAVERLARFGDRFAELISEERPLEEVELALRRMGERQILKAAIRPGLSAP